MGLHSEIKEGNKRLSKLHSELDRWCQANKVSRDYFKLRMTAPYVYECELDEDNDTTLIFMTTWYGTPYKTASTLTNSSL